MTLPSSGPISLYQIADEFGLARATPFPAGFYGKGGSPSSGPLSFDDFYGRSNFSLSASPSSIAADGYNASQTATITSTVATTFTFTGSDPRVTTGTTDSTHAFVRITAPSTGTGSTSGTIRVTAANGDFIDVPYEASWGGA